MDHRGIKGLNPPCGPLQSLAIPPPFRWPPPGRVRLHVGVVHFASSARMHRPVPGSPSPGALCRCQNVEGLREERLRPSGRHSAVSGQSQDVYVENSVSSRSNTEEMGRPRTYWVF